MAQQPQHWVDQVTQHHIQEMEGDIQALIRQFSGDFDADRSDVPTDEYLQMRRDTWMDAKARQSWVDQVGPDQFFTEYFQAFQVPEAAQRHFLEAIEAGLPFDSAVAYANQLGYPPPPPEALMAPPMPMPMPPGMPMGPVANPPMAPPPLPAMPMPIPGMPVEPQVGPAAVQPSYPVALPPGGSPTPWLGG